MLPCFFASDSFKTYNTQITYLKPVQSQLQEHYNGTHTCKSGCPCNDILNFTGDAIHAWTTLLLKSIKWVIISLKTTHLFHITSCARSMVCKLTSTRLSNTAAPVTSTYFHEHKFNACMDGQHVQSVHEQEHVLKLQFLDMCIQPLNGTILT